MKIITDDRCAGYAHPGHPERPERIAASVSGSGNKPSCHWPGANPAD